MIRDQLIYAMSRLAAFARQREWHSGEAAGLTPTQGDILRLLAERRGGLRLKDVAAHLSVRPATASDAVTALVSKGLVSKQADADSLRAVQISLTADGLAMLGQMPDGYDAIVGLLSADDVEALYGIVRRTITQLQRAGQIAPQRMCLTCRHFVSESDSAKPGLAFCNLIGAPLAPADLRINCPEHEEPVSSA